MLSHVLIAAGNDLSVTMAEYRWMLVWVAVWLPFAASLRPPTGTG